MSVLRTGRQRTGAVFLAWLHGDPSALGFIPLHILYAALATALGAWVLTLDEDLVAHLRRRLR
jgi:hypothetical protein